MLFELGNEVYDPRQGPQPGGYSSADDYLHDVKPVVEAIHAARGRAGIVLATSPFFYAPDAPGWGPRYAAWNRDIVSKCSQDGCPFDAIVVHNYRLELSVLQQYRPDEWMQVLLALPEACMRNADRSMLGLPTDVKLWLTENNGMFAGMVQERGTGIFAAARNLYHNYGRKPQKKNTFPSRPSSPDHPLLHE